MCLVLSPTFGRSGFDSRKGGLLRLDDAIILRKIIIPLAKPALATSVVLTFQQVWQNVESSNNYITSESLRTLTYYVNSVGTNNAVAAAGMMAAAQLVMFIPNLIIFIAMQSKVMNTMSHSGIK